MCAQRTYHHRRRGPERPRPRVYQNGIFSSSRRGFGFVSSADAEYFVPAKHARYAMDGDSVEFVLLPKEEHGQKQQRSCARIVRVLERAHTQIIGTLRIFDGMPLLEPLDPRICDFAYVSPANLKNAKNGDAVRCTIVSYPSRYEELCVVVDELIEAGESQDPEIDLVLAAHDVSQAFSEVALHQARACRLDVDAALADAGRRDIRSRLVFTIDPEDARDFDDAISLDTMEDGRIRLGVHIADVSAYVPFGSPLDLEARSRGCSVYLADRVIPMLPQELSCELCSLKPREDRLAFSVDLYIDEQGVCRSHDCYRSVIRSSYRLDYGQVQSFFDGGALPLELADPALEDRLCQLSRIAKQRFAMRRDKGGIDFDNPEIKLVLDDEGQVLKILQKRRSDATSAIEEAMILANESVASHLENVLESSLFRVHEVPDREHMEGLIPLLEYLGYDCEGLAQADPKAICRVLERSTGRPEQDFVMGKVLRALKRALYSTRNCGHFGLASGSYTHFTSPIRRYPDLMAHRLLSACLEMPFKPEESLALCEDLDAICQHSSIMERIAQECAYDSIQIKLCRYMRQHIGQRFPAVITGFSGQNVMLLLEAGIRGIVCLDALSWDEFELDDNGLCLRSPNGQRSYRIGQRVEAQVLKVELRSREIRLRILD